jgi:hypothetical protein
MQIEEKPRQEPESLRVQQFCIDTLAGRRARPTGPGNMCLDSEVVRHGCAREAPRVGPARGVHVGHGQGRRPRRPGRRDSQTLAALRCWLIQAIGDAARIQLDPLRIRLVKFVA